MEDLEAKEAEAPELPTPLAKRFVRYVVGFGIAVGLGLAPFLGMVPGFDALLSLYPESMRSTLIPLSAFLMGVVAVAVQFYAGESIGRETLRKRFRLSLIGLLAGLLLLIVLYILFVVRVSADDLPVVVAWSRTPACETRCRDLSDTQCIEQISTNPAAIEMCWGSRPLQLSRLALGLSYLVVTGGFGALIGLLLIQEEALKRKRRRTRKQAAPTENTR